MRVRHEGLAGTLCWAVVAVGCSAQAALAARQEPGVTHVAKPSAMTVRYMMRDMETIATVLDLDSVQVSIVETMLSDYLAATAVSRPVNEYPALAEDFRANVQAVLSEDQFSRWAEVDTAVRRSRLPIGSVIPGEGIDVVALASGILEAPERDAREFVAASREYSQALDPLLARRTELLDALRAAMVQRTSETALRAMADEVGPLRVAIRDLNQRTADHIAALLSPERGLRLRDEVVRTAYPSVFSAGEAEALVRRAREESRDDPELRERIGMIADALESRLSDARARAIDAVRARGELSVGVRNGLTQEQVDERIKASEAELMEVDDWVIDTLVVEMPAASGTGRYLRELTEGRDRFRRLRDANAWGDQDATLREFDGNGDGVLDAAEAGQVFRTYTANVSRFAKYRL